MSEMPFRIRVLGTPGLLGPDGGEVQLPIGKPLALLTYLAVRREPVPRDHLGELFWPGAPKQNQRASLRQALWILRKALGTDPFQAEDPLALEPGLIDVDLVVAEHLCRTGRPLEAAELWTRPPFAEFFLPGARGWTRWAEELRRHAEGVVGSSLEALAVAAEHRGDLDEAVKARKAGARIQPERSRHLLALVRLHLDRREFAAAGECLAQARVRFKDRAEVRKSLDELEAELATLRRGAMAEDDGLPLNLPFTGRAREFGILAGLWESAAAGQGTRATVLGQAGLGKTRLLEEVALLARSRGGRIVRAEGHRGEGTIRWAGASALARQLARLSGAHGVSASTDEVLLALAPSLDRNSRRNSERSGSPGRPHPGPPTPPADAAVVDALTDLVSAVAEDGPVLVLVDNLQWLDDASQAALTAVARRTAGDAVFWLCTHRPRATGGGRSKADPKDGPEPESARIELKPWDFDEIQELLGQIATFPDPEPLEKAAGLLLDAGEGNPGIIRALLGIFVERGVLTSHEHPPEARLGEGDGDEGWTFNPLAPAGPLLAPGELDAIRATVLGPQSAPDEDNGGESARARHRTAAILVLLGAGLLAGGVVAQRMLPNDPPPPPYGGGVVVIGVGDRFMALSPQAGTVSQWEWEELEAPTEIGTSRQLPGLGPNGQHLWFEHRTTLEEAPWIVLADDDGSDRVLVRTPGDDYFLDLSPDGERFLYRSERPGAGRYILDLWIGDVDGDARRRILAGDIRDAVWAPGGSRIAAFVRGEPDALTIVTPDGHVLHQIPAPDVTSVRWCGPDRLLVTTQRGDRVGMEIRTQEGQVERVIPVEENALETAACSPDGRAVLYPLAARGRMSYTLYDLDQDVGLPLETEHEFARFRLTWLPDAPRPTPRALQIEPRVRELAWGERTSLQAWIILSDGSRIPAENLEWSTENASVLSVSPQGRVHANALGQGWVMGTWQDWLSDTLRVRVVGTPGDGTLFAEDFRTLDQARWIPVGSPVPRASLHEGEPVLELRGDGRHWDGLLLREPVSGALGLTVELELRLPLTGRDRQWFRVCLYDGDLLKIENEEGGTDIYTLESLARQFPCLSYPRYSSSTVDPTSVSLSVLRGVRNLHITLPEPIAPMQTDWVHMALQLRADGEFQVLLDREVLATSPIPFYNGPDSRWRVALFGAVLETEGQVRNLAIWPGTRFGEH